MQELPAARNYREFLPPAELRRLVRAVWVQTVPRTDSTYRQRHIPHGGCEIVLPVGGVGHIVGPRLQSVDYRIERGQTIYGVRLRPGAAGKLLGLPGAEVSGRDVALTDL